MSQLNSKEKSGLLSGLDNILSLEISKWLNGNRWLIQCCIWLLLINGIMTQELIFAPLRDSAMEVAGTYMVNEAVGLFYQLLLSIGPIGVIVLMQGNLIDESQDGSMEWMLSAPLNRAAVIAGKFIVNSVFLLSIAVLLQGTVGFVLINRFADGTVQLVPFIYSFTVSGLYLVFWISLTLMLGSFLEKRAILLGTSIGFLVLQGIIGTTLGRINPIFKEIMPGMLQRTVIMIANGEAVNSYLPLLANFGWITLFIGLAIWRFNRVEF